MKNKIADTVRNCGMSLYRLADHMELPHQTVYDWANGRSQPTYENMEKICQVLNCTLDDLFEADRLPAAPVDALHLDGNLFLFYKLILSHKQVSTSQAKQLMDVSRSWEIWHMGKQLEKLGLVMMTHPGTHSGFNARTHHQCVYRLVEKQESLAIRTFNNTKCGGDPGDPITEVLAQYHL